MAWLQCSAGCRSLLRHRKFGALQVPLDGEIVFGEAQVSMQHITGEAMPSRQAKGSSVPAGSQNHDGVLVVRATALSDDSTPARISRMASNAQV